MGVSFAAFAAELRAFDNRREVVNQIRRDLRKSMPSFRTDVRASALGVLPSTGGLNQWVASSRITVNFRDSGRRAGVKIKMGRNSGSGRADLDRLDRLGVIRHPLYGNRAYWFPQNVPSGFFTDVFEETDWRGIADQAFDRALDQIRKG